jgi:hypothetical protein
MEMLKCAPVWGPFEHLGNEGKCTIDEQLSLSKQTSLVLCNVSEVVSQIYKIHT